VSLFIADMVTIGLLAFVFVGSLHVRACRFLQHLSTFKVAEVRSYQTMDSGYNLYDSHSDLKGLIVARMTTCH